MIDISNVTKVYTSRTGGEVVALDDVSLRIADGEFVTLIGPSGCGKSTMLDILAGLTPLTEGGVDLGQGRAGDVGAKVGMVFQRPVLFPWRTTAENVYLPAVVGKRPALRDSSSADLKARTQDLLSLVGLDGFSEKYPWELSGGMQARVAIARALLLETDVLCMDEPFAALDEFTREQMHLEIQDIWQRKGFTVVFVTHNIFEAVFLSDRVVVMSPRPGRIVEDITVDLPRPRTPELIGSIEFTQAVAAVRKSMLQFWEPRRHGDSDDQ
jgi:NitT/TauT family transport system ATP-binding protein